MSEMIRADVEAKLTEKSPWHYEGTVLGSVDERGVTRFEFRQEMLAWPFVRLVYVSPPECEHPVNK